MKLFRFLIVTIALLVTAQSFAQQGQNQWLIGHWDGTIEGFPASENSSRILRVHSVSPDGKAVALWAVSGSNASQTETITDGSGVKIAFQGISTVVELTREGDSSLTGKYTNTSGKVFPIKFKKLSSPRSWTASGKVQRQTTQEILATARTEPIA